jgi:hypothetical protein
VKVDTAIKAAAANVFTSVFYRNDLFLIGDKAIMSTIFKHS